MEDTLRSGKRQKNFRYFLLIARATPQAFAFFLIKKISTGNNFQAKALIFLFSFPSRLPINWSQCELWGKIKRRRRSTSNVGKKKTEVIAIVRKRAFSLSHTSEPAGT